MTSNKHEQQLFEQILSKFIINLPQAELEDSNRLSYQTEKAFYYYLDSVINNSNPQNWEKFRNQFLAKLAQYSPGSLRIDPRKIIMKLQENKPVCGALIFNKDDSKILTIRVRNKFGFPKGKWNQHQTARECAAREVQEQTGIYIHNRMEPNISIEFESHGNSTTFFIVRGVSEDERLRIDSKEIDEIFWMRLQDIEPNRWKLAEKSRMAWDQYLKLSKKSDADLCVFEKFMNKYSGQQKKKEQISGNPFLLFKFDKEALRNALLVGL